MPATEALPLKLLYERDETAWLEAIAAMVASGNYSELDDSHLSEYLLDMAKRDRREVLSRLIVLLAHLLKWTRQPDQRSASWKGTIREQRRELRQLLESGTLRNHAENVFADAYAEAREQAADETGEKLAEIPAQSPWTLDESLENPID